MSALRLTLPGPVVVRLVACLVLAAFGGLAWGDMVQPEAGGRLLGAAAAGGVLGAAALAAGRLRRPLRALLLAAIAVVAAAAALVLAGVPVRMLGPELWDDLAGALGEGIAALPGLNVPYRGVDEWNRVAMLVGGTALAVAGPLLALWPGRSGRPSGPGVAAVVLAVLYAVPAVQLPADHPFLDGVVFAVLLAALVFGERLARRDLPVAIPALVAASLAGLLAAPRLDSAEPWVDYESIAQSLGERGTMSFTWDHRYGPLEWPRDGRQVLRIRADRGSYWKATTLTYFDGLRWRDVAPRDISSDPAAATPQPDWVDSLRVTVRNLTTRHFVAAGTTLRIVRSPREIDEGAPGSFITRGEPLRRGHAYIARVYDPRPTSDQLEAAGADYPASLWPYLTMQLPRTVGGPAAIDPVTRLPNPDGPHAFVAFSPWGDPSPAIGYQGLSGGEPVGDMWIRGSAYARMYNLAKSLAAEAPTPYAFVRSVQRHLQRGFTYTENPRVRRVPLDAFLFEDKSGYCQQFSGAMALLLRMGGVPARVASGFTPGMYDENRGEYVVRDFDAHSWVEAYFPEIGWVTFDPTPAVAPPRAQTSVFDDEASEAAGPDGDAVAADSGSEPEPRTGPAETRGTAGATDSTGTGGSPAALYVALGVVAALVVAALVATIAGRRRRATMSPADHVRELERALRRSGRLHVEGLTLRALERRLRATPGAAAYVRSLREGRYGYGNGSPTARQRAALRRELAAGLGVRGRVRALWALPPW